VLARIGAEVAGEQLEVAHAPRQFDEDGRVVNQLLRSRLGAMIGSLQEQIDSGRALPAAA
jgi:hypothetical protein